PTNTFAIAVLPVPALLDVTLPVVLCLSPTVWPVTFTLNVQEPPAGIEPPERFTTPKPPTVPVVIVPAPQEPVSPLGKGTARPPGRVSLKATQLRAVVAFGLTIVKVSCVVPLSGIAGGLNTLAMEGGPTTLAMEG